MTRCLHSLLVLLLALAAVPSWAEDAAGAWGGHLLGKLRVIVRLAADDKGQLTGTLESLDQGNAVLQLADIRATPEQLEFAAPQAKSTYKGHWDREKKAWVGAWLQGQPMALTLTRLNGPDDKPALPKRPQEQAIASGNWPYTVQDVTFDSTAADVHLAGSFSAPKGAGPYATVLLIAGSGPNTRDEDVFGHKVFLVLADALNRAGFAVLRYDKRGIGASSGNYATATSEDFATDARAALAYLRTRPDVDTKRLGVLGHSEGGVIAPMLAASDPDVDFVVLLAAPGVSGQRVLLSQKALFLRADGASDAQIERAMGFNRKMFDVLAQAPSADDARGQVAAMLAPLVASHEITQQRADQVIAEVASPWMRFFMRYDPVPALKKVAVPVLALNGSLDLQVEPVENLAAVRLALVGNKNATVADMPGLNHLFQTAKTGTVSEYAAIEETMAAAALDKITTWVTAHTRK